MELVEFLLGRYLAMSTLRGPGVTEVVGPTSRGVLR
jgi:hypothetical protein